jgi:hypothetical protein
VLGCTCLLLLLPAHCDMHHVHVLAVAARQLTGLQYVNVLCITEQDQALHAMVSHGWACL